MAGDNKRITRLRRWHADAKQKPALLSAANEVVGPLGEKIIALALVVGDEVAADFLRLWAEVLAARGRGARRRKSTFVPSISGRRARNAEADMSDRLSLLLGGESVSDMARRKAHRDGISIDAARRHLTRLKKELRDEPPPSPSIETLTEAEQPNWLLRMAGIRR